MEGCAHAEAAGVLAHVARWHENCIEAIADLVEGRKPAQQDVDALNATWAEADAEVDRPEAWKRCSSSHDRLRAAVAAVPDERWSQDFVRALHWDTWAHYGDHVAWLSAG